MINPSLMAFDMIQQDLGNRQFEVYEGFKKLEYATNAMVAKHINLPINCVTGRSLELRQKGFIERSHISRCPVTKNRAQYWKLKLNTQEVINGKRTKFQHD